MRADLRPHFSAVLLAGFAGLCRSQLSDLWCAGIPVTERTREIRCAWRWAPNLRASFAGAGRERPVLAGTVAGTAGAMALTGCFKTMLFGVGARDAGYLLPRFCSG